MNNNFKNHSGIGNSDHRKQDLDDIARVKCDLVCSQCPIKTPDALINLEWNSRIQSRVSFTLLAQTSEIEISVATTCTSILHIQTVKNAYFFICGNRSGILNPRLECFSLPFLPSVRTCVYAKNVK